MKIEQLYTSCLAQGAYYIESEGEAAIIDPLREVQQYIDLAEKRGAKIRYIFETHFHADFVSGHIDLSKKTGAPIIYGPTQMKTGFKCTIAEDGQEFPLGKSCIRLIHTPGHTLESSCYLLLDENGKETALFTGDTLFIGDVGRPDLAQHVIAELTQEKLASLLYDSLRLKIMPLDDSLIIYPGHGAGSACGKKMSSETVDTLGHQKATNYALNMDLSRKDFIKEVLSGLTPPPGYFPKNVLMNINGYESIDLVIEHATRPIDATELEWMLSVEDVLILDTRHADEFGKGFIPGSINVGLKGNFAVWVGTVVKDIKQKIVLVTDPGQEKEAAIRLARVGYDNTLGYLEGGFESWKNAGFNTDSVISISAEELALLHTPNIIDVRKHSEFESEHIDGAINIPLDYINDAVVDPDKHKTWYIHCAGGYRSMVFISIMKKRGYDKLINVSGGFSDIKKSGKFKITNYAEPLTML